MNTPTHRGSSAWLRHLIPRDRIWRLVDAKGQVLGRVANQIAEVLRGRHKPTFFDNMDCGDPVVVINAKHIVLTGRKSTNKVYWHHSGYPGGLKEVPIQEVMRKRPKHPLYRAVYNMLPRNKLRTIWMDNLHIYLDDQHDHHAQKPVLLGPAHINMRLKIGGPPLANEIDTWWTETMSNVEHSGITDVLHKVQSERPNYSLSRGLADLLESDVGDDTAMVTPLNPQLKNYLTAAEKALQLDPVVMSSQVLNT